AVEHGAGGEARQVAARAGLAHPEAPRDLGPQRRQQPAVLLLRRAGVAQRRRDDPETLRVEAARDLAPLHLLEVDHLLARRGVAPTELGRPARDEPTRVEEPPLPVARPRLEVGARALRCGEHLAGRGVLVEPPDELGPEPLVGVAVVESHSGSDAT